jgi:NTF2 fold immunity protein
MRNLIFALCTLVVIATSATAGPEGSLPSEGAVPTADTAVKIARAVLVAWVGEMEIQMEEPLTAHLNANDNWVVTGTMRKGALGGVGEVEIARRDGRILRMFHGQ